MPIKGEDSIARAVALRANALAQESRDVSDADPTANVHVLKGIVAELADEVAKLARILDRQHRPS